MANKSRKHRLKILWFLSELCLGLLAQSDNESKKTISNKCKGKRVPSSYCHHGWLATPAPKTCVKLDDDEATFRTAAHLCRTKYGAHLYTSTTGQQSTWITEQFESQRMWVGLTDMYREGVWRWMNGEPMQEWRWLNGEPNGGTGQNCAFLVTKKFADDKCSRKRTFLCQKSSRMGPREMSMTIHWHGKDVFFEGLQAKVSCSAFFPDGPFTWYSSPKHEGANITQQRVFDLNSDGECGLKVTSTYTYTAAKNLRNLKLTCNARRYRGNKCPGGSTEDAFCLSTPPLRVEEDEGPALDPNQPKPGPVQIKVKKIVGMWNGYYINITCTSVNSPGGIIKRMFTQGIVYNVEIEEISEQTTHVMVPNGLGKMENQTVLTIAFPQYDGIEGLKLICYHQDAYIGYKRYPQNLCPTSLSNTGVCAKAGSFEWAESDFEIYQMHTSTTSEGNTPDRPSPPDSRQDQDENEPLLSITTPEANTPNRSSQPDYINRDNIDPLQPSNRPGQKTPDSPSQPELRPDIRPRVSVKYKGAPGPIRAGYPVLVECQLETSKPDETVWTVRPSEAPFVWDSNIFEHSTRIMYSKKEGTNHHNVTLKYVFNMTAKIAGTTFACFSHGVNKKQKCDTRKDLLCDATEPLKLAEKIVTQNNQFDETRVTMNMHRVDGVHFLGGTVVATCQSREIVDGTFVWVLMKDETPANVYTREHDKGTQRVKGMKTSTLTLNVTESLNGVKLTCYSVYFMYFHGCPTDSSPNYCRTSRQIYVVDGPKDTPKLTIWYPGYPRPARVGTNMTSNCIVYIGEENGSFLWVIYMKDRTIHFKEEGEKIKHYSVQVDKNGEWYINSTIEFTVNQIMDGMQIACFAYDPGRYYRNTIKCTDADKYCYISTAIQVVRGSPGQSPVGTFTVVLASLLLGFGCAMASTLQRGAEHSEDPRKGAETSLDEPVGRPTQVEGSSHTQTQAVISKTPRSSTSIH